MDKTILKEYIDACRLIEETEADLRRLRIEYEQNSVDVVKGSNPVFPFQPMSFRIEGIGYRQYKDPEEIRRIEAILKERREIAKKKRLDVEAWMNAAPSRIQRIVRYRYLMGMTWAEAGKKFGDYTGEAIRKEFSRFMSEDADS